MIVGPNNPIFTNPNSNVPFPATATQILQPGSVPPGARFDPIHPTGNLRDPRTNRPPQFS